MANKKRDEVVDTIRTIYWFRHLTICLGVGSPLEVHRLIEPDREATDTSAIGQVHYTSNV